MDDVKMDMGALAAAIFSRWLRIAVITVALLFATHTVLKFVPKTYESTASILVEPRTSAYTLAANQTLQTGGVADETAVASQIELIKSRGNLMQVMDEENLRDVPELNGASSSIIGTVLRLLFSRPGEVTGLDQIVLGNIAKRLTVVRERDSRIISVIFTSEDPELAARVANAIANTHVKRRAGLYLDDTAEASQWLENEINDLRARVSEAEAKVAAYRVDNDLLEGEGQTSLLDQQLSDIATQISATQERANNAKSRAALIRGLLEAGQPIDGVPDVRESVVVAQLSEEKARLQGERAQLLATLLPNHPSVKALSAQIEEINNQITAEGRQVAEALEASAKIEATLESSLRDELTRLKIEASNATRGTVGLNELEREAKAQRDLLETYLLRYRDAASRTDANAALPDVRVISVAAASINPASPKTTLILAAVAFVSVLLQVGHILFVELVSGRAFVETGASDTAPRRREPEPQPQPQPVPRKAVPSLAGLMPKRREAQPAPHREEPPQQDNDSLAGLAGEIARQNVQLVLCAALGPATQTRPIVETLTAELVRHGSSTVEIDAGSGEPTADLGVSDLCAGVADFGEIVHRGRRSDFALVPWGQQRGIGLASARVETLVEALADVFEVVLVDTGRFGASSVLQAFAGYEPLLVLAVPSDIHNDQIEAIREELAEIGFGNTHFLAGDRPGARAA